MLKKDVAATFVGNWLSMILSFAGTVIMSRMLGAEGRGLLALAILVPFTMLTFLTLGQDSVNSTFAGIEKDKRGSLLLHTILFSSVGTVVSVLVLCSFFYWLPIPRGSFANLSKPVVAISMAIVPVSVFNSLILSLVRGVGQIGFAAVLRVLTTATTVLCLLVFLVLLRMGVEAAVGVLAFSPLPAAVAGVWALRKDIRLGTMKFDRDLFIRSLSFGVPLALASFTGYLVHRLDQGILAYLVDEWRLGLYAVAVTLSDQVTVIPGSISTAFLPRLANELDSRRGQVPMVFRLTVVVSFVAMAGVGVLGIPVILFLYGWEFAGSIPSFLMLLPGVVGLGGAAILSGDLLTRKKTGYNLTVGLVTLVVSAGLNLALIPLLGIFGAALAGTISYFAALVMWIVFYRRESKTPLGELMPMPADVARTYTLSRDMLKAVWRKISSRAP